MFLVVEKFFDGLVHVDDFPLLESDDEGIGKLVENRLAQSADFVVVGRSAVGVADESAVVEALAPLQAFEALVVEAQPVLAGENLHLEHGGVPWSLVGLLGLRRGLGSLLGVLLGRWLLVWCLGCGC